RRCSHGVRRKHNRRLPPRWRVGRKNSERCQAFRSSSRGASEARTDRQPQDGEDAWSHDPALAAGARGPGDPVISRRAFVASRTGSLLTAPLAVEAQQAGKVYRIGVLGAGSESEYKSKVEAMRQGLRDLGYIDGKNVTIEYRWAEGRYERLPDLAAA